MPARASEFLSKTTMEVPKIDYRTIKKSNKMMIFFACSMPEEK
jgi:hypothetical protein